MGAIIGSFFNMLIYRLPNGISLINPKRSVCPKCATTIKWQHNIPLFSYLYLLGKCSYCKNKIPLRYFFVELLTATITLLLFIKFSLSFDFFLYLAFCYILLLLSFIDLDFKAVPDYLLILVLLVALSTQYDDLFKVMQNGMLFAGGIVLIELFVTFYIQNIKTKITKNKNLEDQKALGDGDIPIIASIGIVLGVELGMIALFLAALFTIIPSIYNSFFKNEIETPFIPFLSLGFISALLLEEYLLSII